MIFKKKVREKEGQIFCWRRKPLVLV